MPDARPAPTPSPVRDPRWMLRAGAGVVGAAVAAVAATTAVRVRRMRRVTPTHDLDHTATVGEGPGEPVRVLVLGDSAARGYGLADPADAFPQQLARHVAAATGRRVHVTCLATDGHRTADVLDEQVPRVRSVRPDAVVVSVGVNDAVGGTRPADLRRATRALLTAVEVAADGAVRVLVTCPDLRRVPRLPWPVGAALGWRCRRVAAAQARGVADLDVGVVPLPVVDPTLYGDDGFHPGAEAHAAMARATAEALLARATDVRGATDPDRGAPTWTCS